MTDLLTATTPHHQGDVLLPIVFTTPTVTYALPGQKFMIPASWRRYQLSQLINKSLALDRPVPFDFVVRGEMLKGTLAEWCAERGVGQEETLEVEYIESLLPPQRMSEIPHEDWVSSVSCRIPGYFFTASYDGHIRVFNYAQSLLHTCTPTPTAAPLTSLCVVPARGAGSEAPEEGPYLVASASLDLTAQLSLVSLSPSAPGAAAAAAPFATLHLHSAPLASVSASPSGAHVLTASWDGLIGLWDTAPCGDGGQGREDEGGDGDGDHADANGGGRKAKRRRAGDASRRATKRKTPLAVLKSHTARVSKAVFGNGSVAGAGSAAERVAYSCGFDSTVRVWDVENGLCTHTITAAEKPMLDLALAQDGGCVLAASTDRTVTMYDPRAGTLAPALGSLAHAATPACLVPVGPHRVASGAYDGVVRVWDLRSAARVAASSAVASPVASLRAWEDANGFATAGGGRKVLALDWERTVMAVGGEAGLEVWKVGEGGVFECK